MKKLKIFFILLTFIFVLVISINYAYLDNHLKQFLGVEEYVLVDRVIDGDTIVINGSSYRLIGINTPERGEKYYNEAKNFLENLIINKTIKIEKKSKDKYKRDLVYVFYEGENINLKMIKEGFANPYFPSSKDKYSENFYKEFEKCSKNICEKSDDICARCIILENIDFEKQEIIFYNRCNYDCNLSKWILKDEGRKKFVFPEYILRKNQKVRIIVGEGKNDKDLFCWDNYDYVWTKSGDSIFLKDSNEKLVIFERIDKNFY